jgi:hypothetical protein
MMTALKTGFFPQPFKTTLRCDHGPRRRFYLGDVGPLCQDCAEAEHERFFARASQYHAENGFTGNYWYPRVWSHKSYEYVLPLQHSRADTLKAWVKGLLKKGSGKEN